MEPNIIIAKDNDGVSEELIKVVKIAFDKATDGKVVIGVSGGSLPKFLVAGMKTDLGKTLDWSKVTFLFCDERMVSVDNPDSTLGVYLNLMKDTNIKEDQFIKVNVDLDVESAAKDYENKLKAVMGENPQADLLLLGMGPDGHTCSLFPGHQLLDEKNAIVAPIKDSPKPPPERVTLTFPVLNDAKSVAFVSTGEGKKEMIRNILKDKNEAFPATRVRPVQGELYWIVDKPAAMLLE